MSSAPSSDAPGHGVETPGDARPLAADSGQAAQRKGSMGTANVFKRAQESKEYLNENERMRPYVQMRKEVGFAAGAGFTAGVYGRMRACLRAYT